MFFTADRKTAACRVTIRHTTDALLEVALSPLSHPADEIYRGYQHIMKTKKPRGDRSVTDQLHELFGIADWQWTRLKVVYERALMEDEFAADLVKQIDAGTLTISGAYRLLSEQAADDDLIGSMSVIKLESVQQQLLQVDSYFKLIGAALRRNMRINTGHMSPDQVRDVVKLTRSFALNMKQVSDQLSRSLTGDDSDNGSENR